MLNTLLSKYSNLAGDKHILATIVKLLNRTVSQKSREIIYDILLRADDKVLAQYMKEMLQ